MTEVRPQREVDLGQRPTTRSTSLASRATRSSRVPGESSGLRAGGWRRSSSSAASGRRAARGRGSDRSAPSRRPARRRSARTAARAPAHAGRSRRRAAAARRRRPARRQRQPRPACFPRPNPIRRWTAELRAAALDGIAKQDEDACLGRPRAAAASTSGRTCSAASTHRLPRPPAVGRSCGNARPGRKGMSPFQKLIEVVQLLTPHNHPAAGGYEAPIRRSRHRSKW